MRGPARLLSVCRHNGALFTRNQILQHAGYKVIPAIGVPEALAAMESGRFELVIIGQLYTTEEKNALATKARTLGMRVLCMHSEAQHPNVNDATAFIHNLEGPERLLAAVAALTNQAASA